MAINLQEDTQPDDKDPRMLPDQIQKVRQLQANRKELSPGVRPNPGRPEENVVLNTPPDFVPPPNLAGIDPHRHLKKKTNPDAATEETEATIPRTRPQEAAGQLGMPSVSRVSKPRKKVIDERFQKVDPPSNMIPYAHLDEHGDGLWLRSFDISDLERIYDAIETKNHTAYLDSLDECVNLDIRDLTSPDCVFTQYWIRMASYPRSPYTMEWTSRYGNELREQIQQVRSTHELLAEAATTMLDVVYLDMSAEEYAEWRAKGISFPTVREAEYIINTTPAEDPTTGRRDYAPGAFAMQNAQYLLLPDDAPIERRMEQKLELFRQRKEVQFLSDIQEFAARAEHGVIESIKLRDSAFEPKAASEFLRSSAEKLYRLAQGISDQNPGVEQSAGVLKLVETAVEYETEADQIDATVKEGKKYTPKEEVIALREINAMDMFPAPNSAPTAKAGL